MIPVGAKSLLRMRMAGKRPQGFVVVTESPAIAKHFRNPLRDMHVIVFDPEKDYDWTVLHGLPVGFITNAERSLVAKTCAAIFDAGPSRLHAHYHGRYETEHDWIIE